ncbi:hypothetical protein C5167_004524 [Papaver somniferum]|uniref:Uncharacterized protein n=1 Tax=Papaver somniferum TaxID=3469 RepID=A0A4Y7JC59_PAPSO|nr:hypothetical protein C5167_004524 [Papaver somniferum]
MTIILGGKSIGNYIEENMHSWIFVQHCSFMYKIEKNYVQAISTKLNRWIGSMFGFVVCMIKCREIS